MTAATYADYAVGDRVFTLAWVGQQFEIVGKDDDLQMISLSTPAGAPTRGELDLFPDTMFLLTKEHWDQIWYWPDRAGETYLDVFERYVASHHVGEIVTGRLFADGLAALSNQLRPSSRPEDSMAFRVHTLDRAAGMVRVQPVAAIGADGTLVTTPDPAIAEDAWQPVGPTVQLRTEMRLYRWCLTYGELTLSWEDV
ncbi:MAG TPA: hypothetical protein VEA78_01995 [Acidimicrobiales bacterium]|nr:hypothetical protein [Acidimicrobiales bacterium]